MKHQKNDTYIKIPKCNKLLWVSPLLLCASNNIVLPGDCTSRGGGILCELVVDAGSLSGRAVAPKLGSVWMRPRLLHWIFWVWGKWADKRKSLCHLGLCKHDWWKIIISKCTANQITAVYNTSFQKRVTLMSHNNSPPYFCCILIIWAQTSN